MVRGHSKFNGLDATIIMQAVKRAVLSFELKMRRRETFNSHAIAVETINLIQEALDNDQLSPDAIEFAIRDVCDQLKARFPLNAIIVNVCENIIQRLQEELLLTKPGDGGSLISTSRSFIDMMVVKYSEDDLPTDSLKGRMKEVLASTLDDLSVSYESIAKFAPWFLLTHDTILTVGLSKSVQIFLEAHKKGITVIVPERAPSYDGAVMAGRLQARGINAIVIPDSAVFAVLPKVDKVVVSANSVLANGGIVSFALTHAVALAAKRYARPFIALYWHLKLTQTMPGPGKVFTSLVQPSKVMPNSDPATPNVITSNPEGDYVPPELITLMIDEDGPHCPTDVFSRVQANFFNDA